MEKKFLAVPVEYIALAQIGLRSLDILILAKISEFERNKLDCFVTNQQFANLFGESVSSVKRSLKNLEDSKLVMSYVKFVKGNGKATKQRLLKVNNGKVKLILASSLMEGSLVGSKNEFGRFKNDKWKVHNEPIKEKEKENKKKIESTQQIEELDSDITEFFKPKSE